MRKFKVKKNLKHKSIHKNKNQNQHLVKIMWLIIMQTLLKRNRLLTNKILLQNKGEATFIWQKNQYKLKRHLYKNSNNEKYFNLVQRSIEHHLNNSKMNITRIDENFYIC